MNIEKQVCTLEQAKKLKELGLAQSISYFCWYELHQHEPIIMKNEDVIGDWHSDSCAAFTVAELGLMINSQEIVTVSDSKAGNICYTAINLIDDWHVRLRYPIVGIETEASARAMILIELIQAGTISVTEVNERLAL